MKKNTEILKSWATKSIMYTVLILSAAFFISKILTEFISAILLTEILFFLAVKFYHLDATLEKYKWFRKLMLLTKIQETQKISKSLNHSQVLLAKFFENMPIAADEDEVTTFNDVAQKYGEEWPFMIPVSRTREKKVTVRGKQVDCPSSYCYLNLCRDERVQNAAVAAANAYSTGNHGPRMLCGNLEILEELEVVIARFFRKEDALVMSSGFLACMSAIQGFARKGDLIVMDKLCHASLRSGAKLSSAKTVTFKHNDFQDAEKVIRAHKYSKLLLVIEGVYSMDGDIGNLPVARALADKYKATLFLDEAHSLGVIGKTGKGTEEYYNYQCSADIIVGTFTKSIASVGGYIACSKRMRDFYTFHATGSVFSAPLSAYHAGAAMKSFEIIEKEPELVTKLQENSEYLRNKFKENGFNIGNSITCVVPVIFRDTLQALKIHKWLLDHGFFSSVVMAPACPITAPRFRITAGSSLTKEQMDSWVNSFIEARKVVPENTELIEMMDGM